MIGACDRPLSIAFVAGILGAGAAIALGSLTGLTDGGSTTVVVEPGDHGHRRRRGRTGPAARQPLRPGRDLRAPSAGVVTLYADLGSEGQAQGSGFVVDGKGTILTNAHVVTNVADAGGGPRARRRQALRRVP